MAYIAVSGRVLPVLSGTCHWQVAFKNVLLHAFGLGSSNQQSTYGLQRVLPGCDKMSLLKRHSQFSHRRSSKDGNLLFQSQLMVLSNVYLICYLLQPMTFDGLSFWRLFRDQDCPYYGRMNISYYKHCIIPIYFVACLAWFSFNLKCKNVLNHSAVNLRKGEQHRLLMLIISHQYADEKKVGALNFNTYFLFFIFPSLYREQMTLTKCIVRL